MRVIDASWSGPDQPRGDSGRAISPPHKGRRAGGAELNEDAVGAGGAEATGRDCRGPRARRVRTAACARPAGGAAPPPRLVGEVAVVEDDDEVVVLGRHGVDDEIGEDAVRSAPGAIGQRECRGTVAPPASADSTSRASRAGSPAAALEARPWAAGAAPPRHSDRLAVAGRSGDEGPPVVGSTRRPAARKSRSSPAATSPVGGPPGATRTRMGGRSHAQRPGTPDRASRNSR